LQIVDIYRDLNKSYKEKDGGTTALSKRKVLSINK
jgi:hypothetical protein